MEKKRADKLMHYLGYAGIILGTVGIILLLLKILNLI